MGVHRRDDPGGSVRRIALIFGTRPEVIKMAPVYRALKESPHFQPLVIVTAQHREMMDQMLAHFDITPDHDLDVMAPMQTLEQLTSRTLTGLGSVLAEEKPHMVLVQGDTASTFVGGLAAFLNKISVGHIEAGLRSHHRFDPFPEEIFRRLTGVVADLHFAPTPWAGDNLLAEGVEPERIFITGNTAIDSLLATVKTGKNRSDGDPAGFSFRSETLSSFLEQTVRENRKLILVEAHRRENLGPPMESIWGAVARIAAELPETAVVASVHRNPLVAGPARAALEGAPRVLLSDPLPYDEWGHLMAAARVILTDSGGLQEEAPALGVPVLLLRNTTERPEAVEAGTVRMVGTDGDAIFDEAVRLVRDDDAHAAMARAANPFGDGLAGRRIAGVLAHHFGLEPELPSPFAPGGQEPLHRERK